MNNDRIELIKQRLSQAMEIQRLDVWDDSHLHAGHAGARAGGGHYRLLVVSPAFAGKRAVQRHRMIYDAVGDAMRADTIHALSIQALTPEEDSKSS